VEGFFYEVNSALAFKASAFLTLEEVAVIPVSESHLAGQSQ